MSEIPSSGTQGVYRARLRSWRSRTSRCERRAAWISNARLTVFGLGVVTAWLVWESRYLSVTWMAIPGVSFLFLVALHGQALRALRGARRAAVLYEKAVARLEGRWAGSGDGGLRFLEEAHPYARDLDVFGSGSLFELLSTTPTPWGARTLADWLREPASSSEVSARQAAVAELRGRLELREDLAVADEGISAEIDPESLARWASSPPALTSRPIRLVALLLAALTTLLVVAWLASYVERTAMLIALGVEASFAMWLRPRVRQVILAVERPGRELGALSRLLSRWEEERLEAPHLMRLQQSLSADGLAASAQIARLLRLVELTDLRLNKMFAPLAALTLWGTQFAFALESWRVRSGASVAGWLSALGELEALLALSVYSYEHPDDPFPELIEEGPLFEGEGLGHPLIPEDRLVRNDLRLGCELRLLVVSGSNMSGKSTLLRTVGTNAVLAQAGAPVRARRLRLSPLAVGASIRIVDSLQEGVSRFYAEIKRIRQIMDMTRGSRPLVFLLDEIFHGTNSHDRRIGAEAVVRRLIEQGAVGLMTTHDLALAKVAESLAPRAANVHFEDELEDGKIRFDYRVRPGVVRKSNALDLMRSVGLEVE